MNCFQKRTAIQIAGVSILLASLASTVAWFVARENSEEGVVALAIEESGRLLHHYDAINLAGPNATDMRLPVTGYFEGVRVVRLSADNERKAREVLDSHISMMEALGRAIAKRDSDTGAHNYRVAWIAANIAEKMGIEGNTMQALIAGSFLHDVGKIGVPDAILLKPGKLDDAEMAIMRTHVNQGKDIVTGAGWLDGAHAVVASHHTKNGTAQATHSSSKVNTFHWLPEFLPLPMCLMHCAPSAPTKSPWASRLPWPCWTKTLVATLTPV